jgi:hypothetical protein
VAVRDVLTIVAFSVFGVLALIGALTVTVAISSAVITRRRERVTLPPALPARPPLTPVGEYVDEADDQPGSSS